MDQQKIIYYSDVMSDDFAGTDIRTVRVGRDFPYRHRSVLWNAAAFLLYYLVAFPLVWIISTLIIIGYVFAISAQYIDHHIHQDGFASRNFIREIMR